MIKVCIEYAVLDGKCVKTDDEIGFETSEI